MDYKKLFEVAGVDTTSGKAKQLVENEKAKVIKSAEGSIDEAKLDKMIDGVIKKYNIQIPHDKIKRVVIGDYEDSDISKVTPRDIVEIIDASF